MRDLHTLLADPIALPCQPLPAERPVLVVAPHPDDETLGCGGTIALLKAEQAEVSVVVISDGTRSHPGSQKYPEAALKQLREQETIAGLSVLGIEPPQITFLHLKDGEVPTPDQTEFAAAVDRCCKALDSISPRLIFLPWRFDPHPDHRASWGLIKTALAQLTIAPRLIEYPIWDWDVEQRGKADATLSFTGWRVEIGRVLEQKRRAIAQYRSQVTNLIDDDPLGFQLAPEMLANFTRPWEVFFEETP